MTNTVYVAEAVRGDLPDIESLVIELTSELRVPKMISTLEIRNGLHKVFGKVNSYLLVAKTNGITIGFLHLNIRQTTFPRKLSVQN